MISPWELSLEREEGDNTLELDDCWNKREEEYRTVPKRKIQLTKNLALFVIVKRTKFTFAVALISEHFTGI